MQRFAIIVSAVFFAAVLTGGLCDGTLPPETPTITGPTAAAFGDTLTFRVSALEPEDGDLQYKLDYGDGTEPVWSAGSYPSELPVSFRYVYADTGRYSVRAMARNEAGLESDWSGPHRVRVEDWSPLAPPPPEGPTVCTTGISYFFTATTTHPQGDSLWFQFDWGDTTGAWSGPVPSGSTYTGVRSWSEPGRYEVRVRARDARERSSAWSDPLLVDLIQLSGDIPTNFRLRAGSGGLTVQLTWSRPVAGPPDEYLVYFRDRGEFEVIVRTNQTLHIHNPAGRTGDYLLAARFDTTLYYATDTLTTRPVHTPLMTIYELNGPGAQGYGWNRMTGLAASYDMGDAGNATSVDLYCTDFATGHRGPVYTVASPSEAPRDPGGGVPPGDWRKSWFAYITGNEHDPLPAFATPLYQDLQDIGPLPLFLAAYTEGQFYALVRITSVDTGTGQVRLESWFQPIPGLRLIAH